MYATSITDRSEPQRRRIGRPLDDRTVFILLLDHRDLSWDSSGSSAALIPSAREPSGSRGLVYALLLAFHVSVDTKLFHGSRR